MILYKDYIIITIVILFDLEVRLYNIVNPVSNKLNKINIQTLAFLTSAREELTLANRKSPLKTAILLPNI